MIICITNIYIHGFFEGCLEIWNFMGLENCVPHENYHVDDFLRFKVDTLLNGCLCQ